MKRAADLRIPRGVKRADSMMKLSNRRKLPRSFARSRLSPSRKHLRISKSMSGIYSGRCRRFTRAQVSMLAVVWMDAIITRLMVSANSYPLMAGPPVSINHCNASSGTSWPFRSLSQRSRNIGMSRWRASCLLRLTWRMLSKGRM
jgi:hypothetical protein